MVRGLATPALVAGALLLFTASAEATTCGLGPDTTHREAVRATFVDSDVVFEGVALSASAADYPSSARFRVVRYLKGSGPGTVDVKTWPGLVGGVDPEPGDAWRIYAERGSEGVLKPIGVPCGPTKELGPKRTERVRATAEVAGLDGSTASTISPAVAIPAAALLLLGSGFGVWRMRRRSG